MATGALYVFGEYAPLAGAPIGSSVDRASETVWLGIELTSGTSDYEPVPFANPGKVGAKMGAYFEDLYYRVHVGNTNIDFGDVSTQKTVKVPMWNAFPHTSSDLNYVNITGSDLSVAPIPPYSVPPTAEFEFEITAAAEGDTEINSVVELGLTTGSIFVFATGRRLVRTMLQAEAPLIETWEWLTDVIEAVDGSEQTISVSGGEYRCKLSYRVMMLSDEELRAFEQTLTLGKGQLLLLDWHLATEVGPILESDMTIAVSDGLFDVRPDEPLIIFDDQLEVSTTALSYDGSTISFVAPIGADFPNGATVVAGASAIVGDVSIKRTNVDYYGDATLEGYLIRPRSTLSRPGSTASLTMFNGRPILDRRPLANSPVETKTLNKLIIDDAKFGALSSSTQIKFPRITGSREWAFRRTGPELDFWKAFADHARGRARPFWLPTFRPDLALSVTPQARTYLVSVVGDKYASHIFPFMETHRWIRMVGSNGTTFMAEVADTYLSGDNSILVLDREIPELGLCRFAEFVLPVRLNSDTIELVHEQAHTKLSLEFITTKPE